MPPAGSDVVLLELERQKEQFRLQFQRNMERLRTAIGFTADDGRVHLPTDDATLRDYDVVYERRMTAFDNDIKERKELFEGIHKVLSEIEKDDIPEESKDESEVKTINPFKIGADPEFLVLKRGKPITSLETKYGIHHRDQFGWDHSGRVAEIKPNPAKSSFRVVRNLKKLVTESEAALKIINDGAQMVAGAFCQSSGVTLGGHIHFDIPINLRKKIKEVYGANSGYADDAEMNMPNPEVNRIVSTLDLYTKCLEALDVLPAEGSRIRRRNGEYGNFGDIRQADGANRFEYRTMCSWMHSPVAAMLALTGAKLCASHPRVVMELLDATEPAKTVEKLFSTFATKDIDAARVTERVFEAKLPIVINPNTDMLTTWKSLSALSSK